MGPRSLPHRTGDGGRLVQAEHIVKNRILRQLPADELKSVQPWLTPMQLRSNAVLQEQGDAIDHMLSVEWHDLAALGHAIRRAN
jgi:hypothetical protein